MKDTHFWIINLTESQLEEIVCSAVEKALNRVSKGIFEDKPIWLARAETADYLKISLPTLDKLTRQGKLISHRLGRKKVYQQNEVLKSMGLLKIKFNN